MTEEAKAASNKSDRELKSVKLAILLFIVAVLLVVAGTAYSVYSSSSQVNASCGFWKALAAVPVTPPPPAKAPSRLGVTIVIEALRTYKGEGCGPLKSASDLAKWADYYHLKMP